MAWRMNIEDARWNPKPVDPTIICDVTLASRLPEPKE